MILQPAPSLPPRRRPSMAALGGVLLAHALLLWLINQYWPIAPAVRYVVYQTIRTITPRSGAITPPTIRPAPLLRPAPSLSVFTRKSDTTVPLKTTLTLPEFTPAKTETAAAAPPEPVPAEKPAPAPVDTPPPVPVPPAPPAPAPIPPAPVPPPPEPPPVPAPAPLPAPAPPAPVPPPPAPTPPTPEPAPAPVPTTVAAPTEPLPAPAPAALSAPPAPVPAPAQAPSEPAPQPYAERLRSPVIDVPVQAGTANAAQAVTVPVLVPAGSGTAGNAGNTGNAASGPARAGGVATPGPALAPASRPAPMPIAQPFVLPPENNPYRYQPAPRGRSLADMANEQLRRGKPTDRLADGMAEAGVPDCTQPGGTGTFGGLLAAPALAMRALQGRCR